MRTRLGILALAIMLLAGCTVTQRVVSRDDPSPLPSLSADPQYEAGYTDGYRDGYADGQLESTPSVPAEESTQPDLETRVTYQKLTVFNDGEGGLQAVYLAEIENTGKAAAALKSAASVDIEDLSGALVKAVQDVAIYPAVIAPGERAYVCQKVVSGEDGLSGEQVARAIFHYTMVLCDQPAELPVAFSDVSISLRDGGPCLTARAENTGGEALDGFRVAAALYDGDGVLRTVITAVLEDLGAGAKKGFEQTAENVEEITDTKGWTARLYAY